MTSYRQKLLTAHGQLSALLSVDKTEMISGATSREVKLAVLETFDLLEASIASAKSEVLEFTL